jgi:ferredoxin-NADP reductase
MSFQASHRVRVVHIEQVTPSIKHFILEAADGSALPRFSGGSHVVVVMRDGEHTYRNPYSLMGDGYHTSQYEIGVRREDASRRGSAFMHEKVRRGDTLELLAPANLFTLERFARRHLLIAGGIGITPFRSMLHDLRRRAADHELHYCVRGPEHAAFWDTISRECGARALLHTGAQRLDLDALLRDQPAGTHVYVCGPKRLIESVKHAASALGWSQAHVHYEEFSHAAGGAAFDVTLARSGRVIHVSEEQTLLEALEDAGLEPPSMCRGGVCGACETGVVAGAVEHRDHVLTPEQKARTRTMMVCVSRAACKGVVIDL